MATNVEKAKAALQAGSADEALVLLWNAVEPARLAGDEAALREIATLARSMPGREAADLLAAAGVQPTEPPASQPEATQAPTRSRRKVFVWLAIVIGFAVFNLVQDLVPDRARTTQPGERPPGAANANGGLHLFPLEGYPPSRLSDVVPAVTPYAGLVYVRNSIPLSPATYDPLRNQFVAELILYRLRQDIEITARHTLVIAVTSVDMYEQRHMTMQRSSVARSDDGLYVVISTFGQARESREAALEQAIREEVRRAWPDSSA